jgi:hypothetical protein
MPHYPWMHILVENRRQCGQSTLSVKEVDQISKIACPNSYAADLAIIVDNIKHILL